MNISVTPIYASLLAIFLIVLAYRVAMTRQKSGIGLGPGDSDQLHRFQRAHANATENIPILVILLFFLEVQGLWPWLLHTCGGLMVFARVFHSMGLSKSGGKSAGRYHGTLITWLLIVIMSLLNLVKALGVF